MFTNVLLPFSGRGIQWVRTAVRSRRRIQEERSEFDYLLHLICPQVLLENGMYIAVVLRSPDAFMKCGEAESHVVYVEIPVTGIFAVDDLHGTSLIAFATLVDDKKVLPRKGELIGSL